MQHIFIIGSKGIPGAYGGYETFVDKLTEHHKEKTDIKYHVSCKAKASGEIEYNNAHCFQIKVPDIGPAQAIYYDVAALHYCVKYIDKHKIQDPIVYILACRIGPFAAHYQRKIHQLGGKLFVNPDGHEWLRSKWSKPVRSYWKYSEKCMVKHSDLLVCDSKNIEKYIHESYQQFQPKTTFIAYGAETRNSKLDDSDSKFNEWLSKCKVKANNYYLIVGRHVPENNYETMIREFMNSGTKRDLAIITNIDKHFYNELNSKLGFENDSRIKFVGTVYDQELLMKIREKAYAYIHGHEVGGTNPSLLEALQSTNVNMLLDVGFNQEVGENAALYWSKQPGDMAKLIEKVDNLSSEEISELGLKAKRRIADAYSWEFIAGRYFNLFMGMER